MLYQVNLGFTHLESEQEADRISCLMDDKLTAAYEKDEGFSSQETGTSYALNVSRGAESIQCKITKDACNVSVSCTACF